MSEWTQRDVGISFRMLVYLYETILYCVTWVRTVIPAVKFYLSIAETGRLIHHIRGR